MALAPLAPFILVVGPRGLTKISYDLFRGLTKRVDPRGLTILVVVSVLVFCPVPFFGDAMPCLDPDIEV